jgi:hypothetical protein
MSAAVSDGHSSNPVPKKKAGLSHARGTDGKMFTYFSPKRLLSFAATGCAWPFQYDFPGDGAM